MAVVNHARLSTLCQRGFKNLLLYLSNIYISMFIFAFIKHLETAYLLSVTWRILSIYVKVCSFSLSAYFNRWMLMVVVPLLFTAMVAYVQYGFQ